MDAQVTPRLRIGATEFGPEDAALLRAVADLASEADAEAVGVAFILLSPFVFGILLPLTE